MKGFIEIAKGKVAKEMILKNPGEGTTTIVKYDEDRLCYKRGQSSFYIDLKEFEAAYKKFKGSILKTNDLKEYKPEIFDSRQKGHSCNCTLFFMYLKEMGIISEVQGKGYAGDPFFVQI